MKNKYFRNVDKVVDFAERLKNRVSATTREQFLSNYDLQDSILYAVGQLGENCEKAFDYLVESGIDVNLLYSLIGMRNRIFHEYDDIDVGIVYDNIKDGIDELLITFKRQQQRQKLFNKIP